jgi:outer membrane receptor protein involved in Fe transport
MHHMPDFRVHRPLWIFGCLAALCSVNLSRAATTPAEDAGGPLQEITVTATRREESLSKVPISVTALTQDAMDLRGIKDFQDIVRFTPGVNVDNSGTNNRGICTTRPMR